MTPVGIPAWIRVLWVAGLLLVLAVHLTRLAPASGRRVRLWHAAHVLAAAGMIDRFWPASSMPIGARAAGVIFAVAGAAALVLCWADLARGGPDAVLAAVTSVDLLAMAYLFAEADGGNLAVPLVLGGWFVLEAFAWASGSLAELTPSEPRNGLSVQISLAFTSAGIALIVMATQFGSATGMPGMPPMPAMPGMPGM